MPVEAGRVLIAHGPSLVGGKPPSMASTAIWVSGQLVSGVWVVDLQHDSIDADLMPALHAQWLLYAAEPKFLRRSSLGLSGSCQA